jgi:hypothetical protein
MRVLLLALFAALLLTAQPQQIYRWKDRTGKEHITNTPPPPGATSLDVPPAQGGANNPPAAALTQAAGQRAKPPAPPGLDPVQVQWWRALDQRLEDARAKQDTAAIEGIVEGLFRDSLWGNGLWAIPLLPVATLALVILLGWWIGSGLKQPWSAGALLLSILVGLALCQLTLSRFLYRIQFLRLQSNLALLENHLGGKLPRGSHQMALQQHLKTLETASKPSAAPWAFLVECRAAEDTMIRVALDP